MPGVVAHLCCPTATATCWPPYSTTTTTSRETGRGTPRLLEAGPRAATAGQVGRPVSQEVVGPDHRPPHVRHRRPVKSKPFPRLPEVTTHEVLELPVIHHGTRVERV